MKNVITRMNGDGWTSNGDQMKVRRKLDKCPTNRKTVVRQNATRQDVGHKTTQCMTTMHTTVDGLKTVVRQYAGRYDGMTTWCRTLVCTTTGDKTLGHQCVGRQDAYRRTKDSRMKIRLKSNGYPMVVGRKFDGKRYE